MLEGGGFPGPVPVLAGLSNVYSHYIATWEEYQVQRYEAASTIFGPHTCGAYIQQYSILAQAILDVSKTFFHCIIITIIVIELSPAWYYLAGPVLVILFVQRLIFFSFFLSFSFVLASDQKYSNVYLLHDQVIYIREGTKQ